MSTSTAPLPLCSGSSVQRFQALTRHRPLFLGSPPPPAFCPLRAHTHSAPASDGAPRGARWRAVMARAPCHCGCRAEGQTRSRPMPRALGRLNGTRSNLASDGISVWACERGRPWTGDLRGVPQLWPWEGGQGRPRLEGAALGLQGPPRVTLMNVPEHQCTQSSFTSSAWTERSLRVGRPGAGLQPAT